MENQSLISVVVASYNYEHYIRETLDSMVKQTDSNFEVIIVDDGSKDNSIEVIKQYVDRYDNFYLYSHPENRNRGLIETVKLGIEKSKGQYIAFCESDDFWTDNHIELLHQTIRTTPDAKLIVNDLKIINLSTHDVYVAFCKRFLAEHCASNIFFALDMNPIPTFSVVCVDRATLLKCDFNTPDARCLDFWLWRQICFENDVHFIAKQTTFWRRHDTSYNVVSQNYDYKVLIDISNKDLIATYGEELFAEKSQSRWRKYPKLLVKIYCLFVRSKSKRLYIRHKHLKHK